MGGYRRGASTTAKQLAIAYVLFKMIAAVIALVPFPIVTPLLVRASKAIDGVTLLAAYQTAYNVVGVLVPAPVHRPVRWTGGGPLPAD
jgi:phosphate:Na+ symporter